MRKGTLFLCAAVLFVIAAGCALKTGGTSTVSDGDVQPEILPDEDGAEFIPDPVDDDSVVEDMDVVEGESVECTGTRDCTDGDPCNGYETCDEDTGTCVSGAPLADGALCGTGDPRMICVSEECIESTCGDGFIDTGAGESCEPPGGDNCNDECHRVCDGPGDCPDDGNPCNGTEYCDTEAGTCRSRDPLAEGEGCGTSPRKICLGGACNESICGDGWTDGVRGEECDDGNDVEGDGCEPVACLYSCHDGDPCDDGHACTDDECDAVTTHTCQHTIAGEGKECRPMAGACDVAELCNGTDADCPADHYIAAETICRNSEGLCDISELCTGDSPACPTDAFQPASEVCRDATGPCDLAENCTGDGPACPEDIGRELGTECDDEDMCTFPDECDEGGDCVGAESGLSDAVMVSAGVDHTCALMRNGEVLCWGKDDKGQLGDSAEASPSLVPVKVELLSTATTISAGGNHTCAVLTGGALVCWGDNASGQIGDDSTTDRFTPVPVEGLSSGVAAVAGGLLHTCAVLDTGALKCWGDNAEGQLGDGTKADSRVPIGVEGLSSGVAAVAAGEKHTCAASDDGVLRCWGKNNRGQVGDDSTDERTSPVVVTTLASGAVAAACGKEHSCALLDTGGVQCWGRNDKGQVGNTDAGGGITTPIDVTGLTSGVGSITADNKHSCARLDTGEAKCWGLNDNGQLDGGSTTQRNTPFGIAMLGESVEQIDAGWEHTCAVLDRGIVLCWGNNDSGQVGNGLTGGNELFPVNVTCITVFE